jgi:hypothetical protein
MNSQKVDTPVTTGVQRIYKYLKELDSGFRRNDERARITTFYEAIKIKNGSKSTLSTPRSEARGMLRVDTERRFLPRFKNRGLAPSNVSILNL